MLSFSNKMKGLKYRERNLYERGNIEHYFTTMLKTYSSTGSIYYSNL